jgi:NADPH:quinone reductase-like Zn-dependent oxidoreductase
VRRAVCSATPNGNTHPIDNIKRKTMPRAYAITAEAIASERARVNDDLDRVDIASIIALDDLELPDLKPRDVKIRVLAVSAEHNIAHAALADTVNITDMRGGKIYPGNSALGEVTEIGGEVTKFKTGDIVITHCNGAPDASGYPLRIWAYDQPDSIGWYGEAAVVEDWQLVHAPIDCGLNLWEIAALPLRAPTAYHLWRRAEGMFRVKVPDEQLATMNVLAFGGGVSELFLMLAKHRGHNAFFCSGSPERRRALEAQGIVGIDQKEFNRFGGRGDIKAFGKEIKSLTGGTGMHVVCDLLRGPVFDAGIAAAARAGVNVSAGWQLGTHVTYNSAGASTKQLTLDHTHYETLAGIDAATSLYGNVFKPTIHNEVYAFEDLPRAMVEMQANQQTGIPIIRVAEEMPASVRSLIP